MHFITSRAAESRGYQESEKESVNIPSNTTIRKTDMRTMDLSLLSFALLLARVTGDGNTRTFTKLNGQKPHLVSFDTKGGEIEVSILSKLIGNFCGV